MFVFDFAVFLGVSFLFFLAMEHGLWALGSLARHQAWASRVRM